MFSSSSPLTSRNLHPKKKETVFSVASLRRNAISLWSKYPHRLPFIPSENDISQKVISPMLHSPSLARGGIIRLVKWSFRQCGPVSIRTAFGKRSFERLYKCVVLSGLVVVSSFCSTNSKKGCERGRCKERATQLILQITCVQLSFWSVKHAESCHM